MNRLVYDEARKSCDKCDMGDLSQLHYECLVTDEGQLWFLHYDAGKKN